MNKYNLKNFFYLIFIIYIIFIINFVVIKYNGNFNLIIDRINSIEHDRKIGVFNYNIVPLKIIKLYIENYSNCQIIINIFGNIFVFIPLGLLLPILFKICRNFAKLLILCLFIILFIEIIQFIFMIGYFDIDDIILNLIGCFIGYLVYKFVLIFFKIKRTTL